MSLVLFSILAYLYAFWCAYVLVMGIYRAHLSQRLVGLNKVLAATPMVWIGGPERGAQAGHTPPPGRPAQTRSGPAAGPRLAVLAALAARPLAATPT